MILTRIANLNVLHKVKQLESMIKPSCIISQYGQHLQTTRLSSSLANYNIPSSNLANNKNHLLLTQLPTTSIFNGNQFRSASTGGDHVRLWVVERVVSSALPILLPSIFIFDNALLEAAVALLVVMHMHWGLEAIIFDYVRPSVVGPIVSKLAFLLLNILSITTLAGILVLIYNGPGIAQIVKDAWAIGKKEEEA